MMRRILAVAALTAAASCTQSLPPAGSPPLAPRGEESCYVAKIAPTKARATITFYGWPDNAPPGNKISHPIVHEHAGGNGTYCNPTTFATERANGKRIPYGTKIYVPFLKQYFVREDLCTTSGPTTGSGSNGCYGLWFDLWIGGNGTSKKRAVVWCERRLTPNRPVDVILYPGDGLPVRHTGPIYRNDPAPRGSCDGKPES